MLPRKLSSVRTLQWISFICSTLIALSHAQTICLEEQNIETISETTPYYIVSVTSAKFASPQDCTDQCSILGYSYSLIESGIYCHCAKADPVHLVASPSCAESCSDGSPCGGELPKYLSKTETSVVTPSNGYFVTIQPMEMPVVSSNDAVTLVFNASGPNMLIFEGGTQIEYISDPTVEFQRAYPGIYTITGILKDQPTVSKLIQVKVAQDPEILNECPITLSVGTPESCTVQFPKQGIDTVYNYTLEVSSKAWSQTGTYTIPGDILFLVGIRPYGTYTNTAEAITSGTLIVLGNSYSSEIRYLTRIVCAFDTAGTIGIYAVTPTCSSGTFCPLANMCMTSDCPSGSKDSLTCGTKLCPSTLSCASSDNICAVGSVPDEKTKSWTLLGSVEISSADFELPTAITIPAGTSLAFGCVGVTDCPTIPVIQSRNIGKDEEADFIINTGGSSEAIAIDYKYIFQIMGRTNTLFEVLQDLTCQAPSPIPNSAAATNGWTVDSKETEAFLIQSDLSYSYMVTTPFSSTILSNNSDIICQVPVGIPVMQTYIRMPLGDPYSFDITFPSGSPIYNAMDIDGVLHYRYQDDATGGFVYTSNLAYAMGGHYNLIGNVSNLLNSVTYSVEVHVIPKIPDTWVINIVCPCMNYDGEFDLSVDMPSTPNPPWAANVTYDLDGQELLVPEEVDFLTEDKGGVAAPLSINKKIKFTESGEQTVTINLTNEFSSVTVIAVVTVEEALKNVSIAFMWRNLDNELMEPLGVNKDNFLANSEVIINVTSSGTPEQYKCFVNETDEEVTSNDLSTNEMSITLTEVVEYTVWCSVSNTLQGSIYAPPRKIFVVNELEGFGIVDSQMTALSNMTKEIWATFIVFQPNSCIKIDFNDGIVETYGLEELCLDKYQNITYIPLLYWAPVKIIHTYEKENFYNVTAIAFDKDKELSAECQIIAATIPCELPSVFITNPNLLSISPLEQFKSLTLALEARAVINCTEEVPTESFWTVTQVDPETGTELLPYDIDTIPSWNFSSLQIPPRFLDYDVYKMAYEVNIFLSIQVLRASAFTFVEIVKTPLLASLTDDGSTRIIRGYGQRIDFNLTKSYDPDDPADISYEESGLNKTFYCRKLNSESYPVNIENETYTGTDRQDMPMSTPPTATGAGCFGNGLIPIQYPAQDFVLFSTAFTSTPETYEFALQVSKDTRISVAYLEVIVQDKVVPLVSIKCINVDNCIEHSGNRYINPFARLNLVGEIETTDKSSLLYEWEIFDTERNVIEIKSSYCLSNADPEACRKSKELAISEEIFADNPEVDQFVFRLTGIDGNGVPGFSEFVLTKNKPPINGKCELMKNEGKVLITKFAIQCNGWIDPEDIGIQSYTYSYTETGVENPTLKTILVTQELNLDLIFPYGKLDVYVEIEDKLMASTKVFLGSITAIMPTQQEVEEYQADQKLQSAAVNNDGNYINQLIVALNSIKENADWLDLTNPNNTANLTEIKRALSKSQQFQLQTAVETMTIQTTKQMKAASTILLSVLECVFANDECSTNVDLATKTLATSLTNKIIAAMQTASISSPQEMIPIIANLIDSMSAMICSSNLIVAIEEFSPTEMESAPDYTYDAGLKENTTVEVDETLQYKANILQTTWERSKTQVDSIMESLHLIYIEIVKRVAVGELVVSNTDNDATVIIGKIYESQFRNGGVNLSSSVIKASVNFPNNFCPSKYVMPDTDCNQIIELKFIVWPCIPYYYPKSIRYLSTGAQVTTLDLYLNGELIHINNEEDPLIINVPKSTERHTVAAPLITPTLNPLINMVYHKFSIGEQHNAFIIYIIAENADITDNDVIYVSPDKLPLPYEYIIAKRLIDLPINEDGYSQLFFNIKNISMETRDIYIGMAELTGKVSATTNLNKTYEDLSEIFEIRYRMKTFSVGCFYFDEYNQQWSNDGLSVSWAGNDMAQCDSNHTSSFSIGYFPIHNTLDFEYIFANVGFVDNLTLYITLIIFTSLFVIMIIWGHFQDRKDAEKRGAIPLPDNKLEDKYLYELTFWTGPDKEASTMSNILLIASGELGETDVRQLPTGDKNLYRRFEVNSFVMATKRPLGLINYLRIFHDNSGEPPLDSWQIQRAVIRDIQTSEKFLFECNTWLALDRSDGRIDKTFNRSLNSEGKNYSERFYLKGNRILNDDHIWLSIFMRSVGSRYTRKERVLVCAAFLFMSMVVSAFWYDTLQESDIEGYFRIGALSFTTEILSVALINLIVAFPITTLLIYIFKRARPKQLKENRAVEGIEQQRFSQLQEKGYDNNLAELQCKVQKMGKIKQKEKAPRNTLPWCTRLLAWLITVILIFASGFFVWAYGIQWGEIKTVKWFSSFLFSFFISVLFLQFIKALIIACISAFMKNDDFFTEDMDCDEELPSLKADEEWKYVNTLDPSFRKKVHNIEGANIEEPRVAALRTRLTKEREMKFVLKNLAKYMIFLIILYIIVNSRTDQKAYRMKTHLMNTFLKQGHLKHDFVGLIKNSNDWWEWCKRVVMQELRAQKMYNGRQPYGLRGYLEDHSNRIMGYGIIRQVRSRKGDCYAPAPMNKVIHQCGGARKAGFEDTRDFCKGWDRNATDIESCDWEEYKYKTAAELQTYNTNGMLGVYSGGGYVFELRAGMDHLLERMEKLHESGWVDQHTKALLLEFSLFNPNANLFSTCIVMAEFKEGGGIIPYWRFEPIRLIPTPGWQGIVSRTAEILFCIATIVFTISELWEMKKYGCGYFNSYWNRAEIISILISYLTIGLYVFKYILTAQATAEFERSNGDAYVRMDIAALIDQYSLYTIGFVVFFSTLKLIRLLQFNNKMNLLALTIKRSWNELKIFLLAFAIVFFAFSCLFYFMFGSDLEQFSTIIGSVLTCFVMMMGKFDYEDMNRINPLSPLLFFLFSVVNSFILINLMLSIIIQTFSQLKAEQQSQDNRLNVIDFVWTSFKQRIRKENFSQRHVILNLKDQQHGSNRREDNANELPGKVGQLLDHINQMYFDGRLDMNDPSSKSLFHGSNTEDTDTMGGYYKHEINYGD